MLWNSAATGRIARGITTSFWIPEIVGRRGILSEAHHGHLTGAELDGVSAETRLEAGITKKQSPPPQRFLYLREQRHLDLRHTLRWIYQDIDTAFRIECAKSVSLHCTRECLRRS